MTLEQQLPQTLPRSAPKPVTNGTPTTSRIAPSPTPVDAFFSSSTWDMGGFSPSMVPWRRGAPEIQSGLRPEPKNLKNFRGFYPFHQGIEAHTLEDPLIMPSESDLQASIK